uniref:Uncharacterized protein AlNc14C2218G13188 n=1 Tax=Albugo laibachii Nc14 TaxID=890382 RepID=F0X2X2_9STRA|nr:conserved hypothetical protein [Albugo laibachii Nc14]|eukprot:CCA28321.1 conserved hypothetical protein [Albugo laibachii Nc14]
MARNMIKDIVSAVKRIKVKKLKFILQRENKIAMSSILRQSAKLLKLEGQRVQQKRAMSGGHGGSPPTGFEAKVRAYLPEDHQIVLATLGFYATVFALCKLKPSKKKEEPIHAIADSTTTEVPSLFDEEFDKWSQISGNLERWEKSLDSIA